MRRVRHPHSDALASAIVSLGWLSSEYMKTSRELVFRVVKPPVRVLGGPRAP
jgi:hypothetical protein